MLKTLAWTMLEPLAWTTAAVGLYWLVWSGVPGFVNRRRLPHWFVVLKTLLLCYLGYVVMLATLTWLVWRPYPPVSHAVAYTAILGTAAFNVFVFWTLRHWVNRVPDDLPTAKRHPQ